MSSLGFVLNKQGQVDKPASLIIGFLFVFASDFDSLLLKLKEFFVLLNLTINISLEDIMKNLLDCCNT